MFGTDLSCSNCQFMTWLTKTRGRGNDIVTYLVGVECRIDPSNPKPLPEDRICLGHSLYVIDTNKLPVEFAAKVAVILAREEQANLANLR